MLAENSSSIHSGHFMVSCIYEEADDESEVVGNVKAEPDRRGYNFEDADWQLRPTYMFGSRSTNTLAIDASLTKLFECMTLAYSGKLVSPKWKNFRGIKVKLKEKIRLNNIIWREWHRQFRQKKSPMICQFEAPVSDRTHSKPEAIVLEGKYWKRRLLCVTTEYIKWRQYYKEKSLQSSGHPDEFSSHISSSAAQTPRCPNPSDQSISALVSDESLLVEPDFAMDFSGTLFSTFNQMFPDPKEISQMGFSDIIQPGLIQLQPSIDDFMDTLPSLSDIWMSSTVAASQNTDDSGIASRSPASVSVSNNSYVDGLDHRLLTDVDSWTTAGFPSDVTNDDVDRQSAIIWHSPESQSHVDSLLQKITTAQTEFSDVVGSRPLQRLQQQIRRVSADSPRSDSTVGVSSSLLTQSELYGSENQMLQQTFGSAAARDSNISHGLTAGQLAPRRSSDHYPAGCYSADSIGLSQMPKQRASSLHAVVQNSSGAQSVVLQPLDRSRNGDGDSFSFVAPLQRAQVQPRTGTQAPASSAGRQVVSGRAATAAAVEPSSRQHTTTTDKLSVDITKRVTFTDDKSVKSSQHQNTRNENTSSHHSSILQALLTRGSQLQSPAAAAAKSRGQRPSEQTEPVANSVKSETVESQARSVVKMPTVNEFHKTLLVAAASEAVGSTLDSRLVNQFLTDAEFVEPASSEDTAPTASATVPAVVESVPQRPHLKEQHMTAEYKRRCNIKHGFDTLNHLVPSLSQVSSGKINKATTLEKTAECCRRMKDERLAMLNEANRLTDEIAALQTDISACQSQLPATGAPVSLTALNAGHMTQLYESYVRSRTLANWKFWIFSLIIRSLFESFSSCVSSIGSSEQLSQCVLAWLQQHCSLVTLRPGVLSSLRHLSTSTSILTDPAGVPQQATDAVSKRT